MLEKEKRNRLGLLLRALLLERSISMRKLSELTEIDTATISRIINGKRNATLGHLEKFSTCLNVPIAKLFVAAGYLVEEEKQQADTQMLVDLIHSYLESSSIHDSDFSIALVKEKLTSYETYVLTEEGSNTILNDFEEKLQNTGSRGPFITQLKELFVKFRSRNATRYELALIGSCLLYFIIPVDAIPDFILPIGYLDDAVAVTLLGKSLSK